VKRRGEPPAFPGVAEQDPIYWPFSAKSRQSHAWFEPAHGTLFCVLARS